MKPYKRINFTNLYDFFPPSHQLIVTLKQINAMDGHIFRKNYESDDEGFKV